MLCFVVPSAIGVEITFGFDSSMMNGLQALGHWVACMISL